MKTHTIIAKEENGNILEQYERKSKKAAILKAVELAKRFQEEANVFICAFNGQCDVYLNPNGNYEPTGISW